MGLVYARLAHGVAEPRVGLLSIEEESKGNELTREAHRLLKASSLHFIGNVEGREIYSGGRTSWSAMASPATSKKTSEGLWRRLKRCSVMNCGKHVLEPGRILCSRNVRFGGSGGGSITRHEGRGVAWRGAGLVIVGHGRSSARAVRNAVAMAHRFATNDFIAKVEQGMGEIASVKH